MKQSRDYISVTHLKPLNYREDYVHLPRNYGSKKYNEREDIKEIKKAVFDNLDTLNERSNFTEQLKDKKVVIKPNLVGVFYKLGFQPEVAPQSTDPRVIDSLIEYLKQFTDKIVIAEASGSGFPTRASFKMSGLTKVARKHKIELIPLEEQSVVRYYLPKSGAMKECLIPEIFDEVARGEAFYISVPKLKTNMYTDVSLGFKNAMGIIPLNLRQRDHNHQLEKKLVDILYIVNPNLTFIDGIIGAQGQCPAVAEACDSHVIISGTNVVETDSVASRIMGFEPDTIKLIAHAKSAGFGNNNVEVIGQNKVVQFKKANPSLMNDQFIKRFPDIKVLIGHEISSAPKINSLDSVTNEIMCKMELACRGGCLVCSKLGLELLVAEGIGNYKATIIIGKGVMVDGKGPYYFDRDGKNYTKEDIVKLEEPKVALGDCASGLEDICKNYIPGCLFHAGAVHMRLHKFSKTRCKMVSSENKFLLPFIIDTLKMRIARRRQIRKGKYIDISLNGINDRNTFDLTNDQKELDYIKWDFPPMKKELKKQLMKEEWESLLVLL